MNFNVRKKRNKKILLTSATALATIAAVFGFINSNNPLWADRANMTRLSFNNALFCQRVSQALNDSLGDGMADGSDCVNFNLYVSTAEIDNIQTLNILPPQDGFGDIDWDSQTMSINGDWVTAFRNLKSLSITNMPVSDISPLQRLSGRLTYLDLSNNRINNVTPLKNLSRSLTYLDLSGNYIYEGLRELSDFTALHTLKLVNTGVTYYDELFRPADIEYDPETGEQLGEQKKRSELAEVLQVLDISENEGLSSESTELSGGCAGNLTPFRDYEPKLSELYVSNDNLNTDDLICISMLPSLRKLDVSKNHIDDFEVIKNATYSTIKADSQTFTREIAALDYSPLPKIFTQAGQEDYFSSIAGVANTAVALDQLDLDNAQFNGSKIRFANAAAASQQNEQPKPATVTIPAGSGVFENSKLQIYFTGQVVTFNDTNLCKSVYSQGASRMAFYDTEGNPTYSSEEPVVLTNSCDMSKQIAMIADGSSLFARLYLDEINNGAPVDLTGLEEFRNLQILSLQNNSLTDISAISDAQSLRQLWLNDNNLSSSNWSILSNFTSLGILYLNNNHMSDIPTSVENLTSLGNLYLVNNGISNIDSLARISSLTVLDLSENSQITDFSGMVQDDYACNPSILKIENAGITQIPSADIISHGFSNLTSLNLNGNQITSETISNLGNASKLDELYLNNNQISDTSGFSGITTLKKLFLDNNNIENISGLASLSKLVELHLSNNQITGIAGLNTLPALATLDVKNQTLTGAIENREESYLLPAVFSQAINTTFPKVNGFQSAGNYEVINGSVDYNEMAATLASDSETMTVTIPDGGLAGTKITLTYGGSGGGSDTFDTPIANNTNGNASITTTSSDTFRVTSGRAYIAIITHDNGGTWERMTPNIVAEDDNTREFHLDQITPDTMITIMNAGDVNGDGNVNVRDARKIINFIIGREYPTSIETVVADVDNKTGINIRDARAIINNIMERAYINW